MSKCFFDQSFTVKLIEVNWPIQNNENDTKTLLQTFRISRYESTVWKSWLVVDFGEVWSFFSESDWSELFHKSNTYVIGNSDDKLKMQFAVESRNYNRIDFYFNQHPWSGRYCIPLFLEYLKLQIKSINYMNSIENTGNWTS